MDQSEAVNSVTAHETMTDKNGIKQVILKNSKGASVRISLYGGQVLSWKTESGEELLFTSTKANFKPPMPVRGGIPICFPQFGTRGLLEQHGFARNRMWEIEQNPPASPTKSNGQAFVDLLLKSDNPTKSDNDPKPDPKPDTKPDTKADAKVDPTADTKPEPKADSKAWGTWPHRFEFRLRVSITEEGNLTLLPRCRNPNGKPFSFNIAFRTYFSISDISEVRVEGLETLDYLDNLCERERFTEQGDALTFENEVDRVYLSSSDVVAIFDHGKKRTFQIRKQGLPDVAVWNPWEKKAKALTDLGDEEYKKMLCVDGAALEKQITLKPGEEWTGQLELSVLSSC